jgi:hypothetical protein
MNGITPASTMVSISQRLQFQDLQHTCQINFHSTTVTLLGKTLITASNN